MKRTILTGLIIWFVTTMNAQIVTDSVSNLKIDTTQLGQSYLKKSKNQKTAAWILLSVGAVATTAGLIVLGKQINDWDLSEDAPLVNDVTSEVLVVSGTVVMLTSIPLFIISHKNKRKAQLYLSDQHAMITPRIQIGRIYSVGVKVPL